MSELEIGRTYSGVTLDFDLDGIYIIELPLKKKKPYAEVIFMGDLHLGHPSFAFNHFMKYIKLVEGNPHIRVVGMGDYLEATEFAPNFLNESRLRTREQIEVLIKVLEPIKDQIAALLYGNHDERIMKNNKMAVDLLEFITLKMRKPDIIRGKPQTGLLLVFKVGKQIYPVYVLHSKTGAIVHSDTQLRRTSMSWNVPLLVHGHTHQKSWSDKTFFSVTTVNGNPMRSINRQYWLSSGAFLRYPSYAQIRSYPVTDIGAPIIRFYADTESIEYVDPLTHREFRKYFIRKHKSTTLESFMMTHIKRSVDVGGVKPIETDRPPCPRCGGYDIMSRGNQWNCRTCGRYWSKDRNT